MTNLGLCFTPEAWYPQNRIIWTIFLPHTAVSVTFGSLSDIGASTQIHVLIHISLTLALPFIRDYYLGLDITR